MKKKKPAVKKNTKSKILTISQALIQTHGYQGFTLQDLADRVGIKKPSLFDHYPNKETLTLELIEIYYQKFTDWTLSISELKPDKKIFAFFQIYLGFANDHEKICPLVALSFDLAKLPKKIHRKIKAFSERILNWLQEVILTGQKTGLFNRRLFSSAYARLGFNLAMGSQICARINKDPDEIKSIAFTFLNLLKMR